MPEPTKLNERVSVLETSVRALHEDLAGIRSAMVAGFHDLQKTQAAASKTNWPVLLSASLLVLALYAAAIHPLQADITRHEASASDIAKAVLEQNRILNETRITLAITQAKLEEESHKLADIAERGPASIDRRLSVVEFKTGIVK